MRIAGPVRYLLPHQMPFRQVLRIAVALLISLAFVGSEVSLAMTADHSAAADRPVPCHAGAAGVTGTMDEAASLPEQAPPDHAPKAPCPMMQGAQCLSLCAAAPPAVGVTVPFERADDSHPWSYETASTPHMIAPPHRPPKQL